MIFCDNAGISYNRMTESEPLETLFHYYINDAQKVIRQVALTTIYCEITYQGPVVQSPIKIILG